MDCGHVGETTKSFRQEFNSSMTDAINIVESESMPETAWEEGWWWAVMRDARRVVYITPLTLRIARDTSHTADDEQGCQGILARTIGTCAKCLQTKRLSERTILL